ncbi:redoxin domain-containing protein [uncultured Tateyamaria sp.]|uniref:redoxin domain-containing protein n=1 Tax=uncultured Tateyamaria sp. TaxID=455651 RepID=UPI002602DE3A|nr:redoxin domain-containing protein [uncultured Tateyamaria sp.]
MTALPAGHPFPKLDIDKLGGGTVTLGAPQGPHDWQLVIIYRGLHCPLCKKYLAELEGMQEKFHAQGVDIVVASGDPEDKARAMAEEFAPTLAMGYGLSVEQMQTLGLYVSDPRSPQETDRPFAEPGLFVVNADGDIQMVDVSNAPFLRPDLEKVLGGITYIRANDYPIRGTHKAA